MKLAAHAEVQSSRDAVALHRCKGLTTTPGLSTCGKGDAAPTGAQAICSGAPETASRQLRDGARNSTTVAHMLPAGAAREAYAALSADSATCSRLLKLSPRWCSTRCASASRIGVFCETRKTANIRHGAARIRHRAKTAAELKDAKCIDAYRWYLGQKQDTAASKQRAARNAVSGGTGRRTALDPHVCMQSCESTLRAYARTRAVRVRASVRAFGIGCGADQRQLHAIARLACRCRMRSARAHARGARCACARQCAPRCRCLWRHGRRRR
eukprot:6203393-Pleurochrysis_carterae.AAC.1